MIGLKVFYLRNVCVFKNLDRLEKVLVHQERAHEKHTKENKMVIKCILVLAMITCSSGDMENGSLVVKTREDNGKPDLDLEKTDNYNNSANIDTFKTIFDIDREFTSLMMQIVAGIMGITRKRNENQENAINTKKEKINFRRTTGKRNNQEIAIHSKNKKINFGRCYFNAVMFHVSCDKQ